jgi:poly(A) polymerase
MLLPETPAAQLALRVAAELRSRGFQALLVGGCVRDLLIGQPVKDFDIATDARPVEITALFPDSGLVGAHFGVVLVHDAGATVEVATFRSDRDYKDGRHPESVDFETSPQKDAERRDFTINALFLDPETRQVLDFVGGRDDLARRIIRAVGEPAQRFKEDHLRMLRAVRFAARLGFTLDPATEQAIRDLAPQIHTVSAERTRDELVRILTEGGARYGFELLHRTGLLHEILPEVEKLQGVEQSPDFHPEGDVWTHTLLMLHLLDRPSPTLAMGTLLHDIGKPDTFVRAPERIRFDGHVQRGIEISNEILRRLKFSNDDTQQILALVANHMRFADVQRMKESTLKRFLRMPQFDEHLALHKVDCLSSHGQLSNYDFSREKLAALPQEALRPPRLLTGNDLIEMGFLPGPLFSDILKELEDAQLEGQIQSSEEARDWVLSRYSQRLP